MNWLIILPKFAGAHPTFSHTQRTKTAKTVLDVPKLPSWGIRDWNFDKFCNETTTFHRFHAKIILKIPNIFPLSSVAGQPVQIPWPLPTNRHASAP
jgi:hypothetical protein